MKKSKVISLGFLLASTMASSAAVTYQLGDGGDITTASETGVLESDGTGTYSTTLSDGSLVSFDVDFTATGGQLNILTGFGGLAAGQTVNGNPDTAINNGESITIAISNVTGLTAAEQLVLTSITTGFGDTSDRYTINGGPDTAFATDGGTDIIDVPQADSVTIGGSVGRFTLRQFTVETTTAVPEPSTTLLGGLALLGFGLRRKRS